MTPIANMKRFVGVVFVLLNLAIVQPQGTFEEEPTLSQVDQIPVSIEWDRSTVRRERVSRQDVDLADSQNAEDDPQQVRVECRPGVEYLRDPLDCRKFYQCSNGVPYHMGCESGLYFNMDLKVCSWPSSVTCDLDRCDRRRVGRLSDTRDNEVSRASCPEGYVPAGCTSSDPRRSDGNVVEGRDCLAVNGLRGRGQRAIATCVSATGRDYMFVTSGDWERNPSVRCPRGYRITDCLLRNPWNDIRFAFPAIDISRNTCSSDITCLAGWGCFVQAICRRT